MSRPHARQLFDPEEHPLAGADESAGYDGRRPPRPGCSSIGALYGQVEGALATAFPRNRQLWVRGEINTLSDQAGRSGHCYFDLVDPDQDGRRFVAAGTGTGLFPP